jgi:hypothetical protein
MVMVHVDWLLEMTVVWQEVTVVKAHRAFPAANMFYKLLLTAELLRF